MTVRESQIERLTALTLSVRPLAASARSTNSFKVGRAGWLQNTRRRLDAPDARFGPSRKARPQR